MEQLHQFLQTLVSTSSYELHLEPNRNPYVVSAGGETDIADKPLNGTQISMMVFPLIPPDVKHELPNQPQIEFIHPHNLGRFNFKVQKTPNGFNVTVQPIFGDIIRTAPQAEPVEETLVESAKASSQPDQAPSFEAAPFETDSFYPKTEAAPDAAVFEKFKPEETLAHEEPPGVESDTEPPTHDSDPTTFDDVFVSNSDEAIRPAAPTPEPESEASINQSPIDDHLAFSAAFGRIFAVEMQCRKNDGGKPVATSGNWKYHAAAALSQTAKTFGLTCKFESGEKFDAIVESMGTMRPISIIAAWEWDYENMFNANNSLDKLRTCCKNNLNATALILTFSPAADYAEHLQEANEFWNTAFLDSKNPPSSLFLHTIIFGRGDETREFESIRSAKINIAAATVVDDFLF